MDTLVENRRDTRTELSWPVSVWLPEANRFFNGQSSNISKNGVFISIPITTPVREGHVVEMNFPRTEDLATVDVVNSVKAGYVFKSNPVGAKILGNRR